MINKKTISYYQFDKIKITVIGYLSEINFYSLKILPISIIWCIYLIEFSVSSFKNSRFG